MYMYTYIRNKNCHQHSYGFQNFMSSWGSWSKFSKLKQVGDFSIFRSKSSHVQRVFWKLGIFLFLIFDYRNDSRISTKKSQNRGVESHKVCQSPGMPASTDNCIREVIYYRNDSRISTKKSRNRGVESLKVSQAQVAVECQTVVIFDKYHF